MYILFRRKNTMFNNYNMMEYTRRVSKFSPLCFQISITFPVDPFIKYIIRTLRAYKHKYMYILLCTSITTHSGREALSLPVTRCNPIHQNIDTCPRIIINTDMCMYIRIFF